MTLSLPHKLLAALGLVLTAAALLQLPGMSAQDAPPPAKKAAGAKKLLPPQDYKDFVFLASDRPVLIRLHLFIDGKPHFEKFFEYFKELFAQLDHNKDGALTKEEAATVPQPQFLQRQLQGQFFGGGPQNSKVALGDLDTDKDGKVSVTEFTDYYRRNNFQPLRFVAGSGAANTERINDAILKHLGVEKDAKLKKEDVVKAAEVFPRLDKNEDEMITLDEIAPQPQQPRGGQRVVPGNPAPPEVSVIDIQPGQPPTVAVQRLLARYEKEKENDEKLSRAEIGLEKESFDSLDANKDEYLDKTEVAKFFQRDADLELVARLGKLDGEDAGDASQGADGESAGTASDQPRIEVFNPKKRPMPLAAVATRVDERTLTIKLGDATLELRTGSESPQRQNRVQNMQFLLERFRDLDPDKSGVLDRKRAQQAPVLLAIFDLANRAGDGKLTEKELKDYLELQALGMNCTTTVQGVDQGRSLFNLFDADHDSRLSARELGTAWTSVQPLASAVDSTLARSDVPRRMNFSLGQGQNVFVAPKSNRSSSQLPVWFTKSDRNNDGDLSPSEFLGSGEDFLALDSDHDGLISTGEARHGEAKHNHAKEGASKDVDK